MNALHLCAAFALCGLAVRSDEPMFVTSMAVDRAGHVWAGTEEGGLYTMKPNGNGWRKDAAFSERYGENVFALHFGDDGLLWAGTLDSGACTWDGSSWRSYGIKEGLPGNRVFAIAPSRNGVFIATDGGVADWDVRRGVLTTYDRSIGLPQNEAAGVADSGRGDIFVATQCNGVFGRMRTHREFRRTPGLEAERCNAMLTLHDKSLAVATASGVWIGSGSGGKWRRLDSCRDYCTSLLQTPVGDVYVGTREHGVTVLDSSCGIRRRLRFGGVTNRVTSLAASVDGTIYVGTYGGGVVRMAGSRSAHGDKPRRQSNKARHPDAPRIVNARPACDKTDGVKAKDCFYMNDDWATKGDWCGRYGGRMARLCSMDAPWGCHVLWRAYGYEAKGRIGEHRYKGDCLRHWVHWTVTDNRNSLYSPLIGRRRQSEWDDHSEAYPESWDGPDLIVSVIVTTGWHRVSFYFNNKDGHEGSNFRRDYTMEVDDGSGVTNRTRVVGFRNGVYKTYALNGPCTKDFRIRRNGSFSTILSGVFIDLFPEPRESQDCPRHTTWLYYGGVVYAPPAASRLSMPTMTDCSPRAFDRWRRKVRQEYRLACERKDDEPVLAAYRWSLREWARSDRKEFDDKMLLAWTGLQFFQPMFRRADYFENSPNVSKKPLDREDYCCETSGGWTKRPDTLNRRPVEEPYKGFFLKLRRIQRETNNKADL